MKQKDIAIMVVAAFVSLILSIVIAKAVFSTPKNLSRQVDVIPPITTSFQTPNQQYFNSQAIDPTQAVNIAPNNNSQPFVSGNH